MSVPNTGGWQVWQTMSVTGVSLMAGQHAFRVVLDADGATGSVVNFNWVAVR